MNIARVFPTKTSMCPTDKDAYFGLPNLWTPKYDEVHISVTFPWAGKRTEFLRANWEQYGKVRIGGVAIDGESDKPMIAGRYLKKGVTITSRGCPNHCPYCLVRRKLIELKHFPEGNTVQDNNLLACSKSHREKVFKMLSKQRHIDFSGGLEASRVTDEIVGQLRGLKIYQLWLAYDQPGQGKPLRMAIEKLSKHFRRDEIRCYVLIGYGDDTLDKAEGRLRLVWEMGALPFAMLYQPKSFIKYSAKWKAFQRQWTRPAIIKFINQ